MGRGFNAGGMGGGWVRDGQYSESYAVDGA